MSEEKIAMIKQLAAKISESKGSEEEIKALKDYLSSIEDESVILSSSKGLGNIGMLPTVLRLLQARRDEIVFIKTLTEKSNQLADPMSSPENRDMISTLQNDIRERISSATTTMIDLAIAHFQKLNNPMHNFVQEKLQLAKQDKSKFNQELITPIPEVVENDTVIKLSKNKTRFQALRKIFQRGKSPELQEEVLAVAEKATTVSISDLDDLDAVDFVEEDAELRLVGLEVEATGFRKAIENFKSKNAERKENVLNGLDNLANKIKKLLIKPPVNEQFIKLAVKLSNHKKDSFMHKKYTSQLNKLINSSNKEDLKAAENKLQDAAFRANPISGVKNHGQFNEVAKSINKKIADKLDSKHTEADQKKNEEELKSEVVESEDTIDESLFTNDQAGLRSILKDIHDDNPHIKFVAAVVDKVNEFDEKNHKKDIKHYSVNQENVNALRSSIVSQLNDLLSKSKDPENIKKAIEKIRSETKKEGNSIARHAALLNVVSVLQSRLEMPVKSQRVLDAYQSGATKARDAVKKAVKEDAAISNQENIAKN